MPCAAGQKLVLVFKSQHVTSTSGMAISTFLCRIDLLEKVQQNLSCPYKNRTLDFVVTYLKQRKNYYRGERDFFE